MNIIDKLKSKDKTDILLIIAIILAVIIGLYFRLKGLSRWSLALDEYYTVKSAENILKYGIPMWDSGGYYTRGILTKYLTAFILLTGAKAEFGARLIIVVANMFAIPALYLLAKKISGKILATVLIIIFCFSVWEVEFARFARMYAPFQTIFLWYFLFLYKNVVEDDTKSWKWLFILSFISIFIHESGIFIVALNFFPFIWKRKLTLVHFLISILISIFSYWYLTFDFWNLNLGNVMPGDIVYKGTDFSHEGYLRFPDLLINYLSFQNLFEWLIIIPFLFSIIVIIKLFLSKLNLSVKILLFSVLVLSVLNQLALAFLFLLAGFLLQWIFLQDFKSKHFRQFIIALLLNSLVWILVLIISDSWYSIFMDDDIVSLPDLMKKGGLVLFNYPLNYYEFQMYNAAIPNFTKVTAIIIIGSLFLFFKERYGHSKDGFRLNLIVVIVMFLLATVVNTPLLETRYTFHVFPLILFITILVFQKLSVSFFKKEFLSFSVFIILTTMYLFISEDFKPNHLFNIDSREINFRIGFSIRLQRHYYPRWDVEGCANVVNRESKPDDIIIINEPNFAYYLKRVDYFYEDFRSGRFGAITTEGGKKERWTNAKLVYTVHSFMDIIINSGKRVWFITRGKMFFNELPFYDNMNEYLFHIGIDGTTRIFLFEPDIKAN